jgi:hypothetical protein
VSPFSDDQRQFSELPVMMVTAYGGAEFLTVISIC